jgi:ribosomal protein S18 acetylase RimI-like enzyme
MEGVTIASAGVAFQMFNAAFLSTPVRTEIEMERRILEAAVHFRVRGIPWAYWLCDGWLDPKVRRRARQLFHKHGLRLSAEMPGMIADTLEPPVRALPQIEVRRVADQSTRSQFCGIGSFCFHVPLPWFLEVFENESVFQRFRGFVGYAGSEAVCTAAVVVSSGVAGVYNVATLPEYQRHGYGEAVMRQALGEVRRECGVERTILQSTAQGLHLYERMGYHAVTGVSVYV